MQKRERVDKAEAFLKDLLAVYEKHGLALGHEDSHGAFKIHPYSKLHVDWVSQAFICFPEGQTCLYPMPDGSHWEV